MIKDTYNKNEILLLLNENMLLVEYYKLKYLFNI